MERAATNTPPDVNPTETINGGPAFPGRHNADKETFVLSEELGQIPEDMNVCWSGMNLRDYFAAKAMQALVAAPVGAFRDFRAWTSRAKDRLLSRPTPSRMR